MNSIYPSIEDIKIDRYIKAQQKNYIAEAEEHVEPSAPYPTLQINNDDIDPHSLKYINQIDTQLKHEDNHSINDACSQISHLTNTTSSSTQENRIQIIAPLSERAPGFERSAITGGLKEVDIYKADEKKFRDLGIKMRAIDHGIFVIGVKTESPAHLSGVKFGDQIIEINTINLTGISLDKVEKLIKKTPSPIAMILRDRPFIRTLTVHNDTMGHPGFIFKHGRIVDIMKETSAARNGLLTHHVLIECNGESCVGLKDSKILEIIKMAGETLNIAIIPTLLYEKMFRK